MPNKAITGLALLALTGVAACAVRTDAFPSSQPDAIAQWTTAMRDSRVGLSRVETYRTPRGKVVFVGAEHSTRADSLAFALIGGVFETSKVNALIVEGSPTSAGPNASNLLDLAASAPESGDQPGGETIPAIRGAISQGADVWGGEPDDVDIVTSVAAQGLDASEIGRFYVLRMFPQLQRQGAADLSDAQKTDAQIETELRYSERDLGMEQGALGTVEAWRQWYADRNRKPFGPDFLLEEVGPLSDGPWGTNSVAAALSRERSKHLHGLIVSLAERHDVVVIVYGRSHLDLHAPALNAVFGPPLQTTNDPGALARLRN